MLRKKVLFQKSRKISSYFSMEDVLDQVTNYDFIVFQTVMISVGETRDQHLELNFLAGIVYQKIEPLSASDGHDIQCSGCVGDYVNY